MPAPEPQANCFYCWGHGTTAEGLVGILTLGRVLRSSAEAVQVAPHDDVFSFYGKATQDGYYEPSKLDFISKLHHGTKNSAGVVVGGPRTTKVSYPARHLRVTNVGLFERLPAASIEFGFCPAPTVLSYQ